MEHQAGWERVEESLDAIAISCGWPDRHRMRAAVLGERARIERSTIPPEPEKGRSMQQAFNEWMRRFVEEPESSSAR